MKFLKMKILILLLLAFSCNKNDNTIATNQNSAYKITKSISYNNVSVDIVIDKPEGNEFDVLMVFHGTVRSDSLILQAEF